MNDTIISEGGGARGGGCGWHGGSEGKLRRTDWRTRHILENDNGDNTTGKVVEYMYT